MSFRLVFSQKRNAVLLAREERELQRLRAERLQKEKRVAELEERLASLRAASPSHGQGHAQ